MNYSLVDSPRGSAENVLFCVLIATALLACLFFASVVRAEPGVVVGSYSSQSNAQAAALTARDKLRHLGLDVSVQVVPAASSNMGNAGNGASRVILLPRSGTSVRALLRQVRTRGFADAWYLAETGVSGAPPARRRIAAAPAQPAPSAAVSYTHLTLPTKAKE